MTGRIKKRTFSGVVCEQEVLTVSPRTICNVLTKTAEPRPRFSTAQERAEFNENRSRRNHTQLVNTNFRPGDWYCTLTFDGELHGSAKTKEGRKRMYRMLNKERKNFIRRIQSKYENVKIMSYMGAGSTGTNPHIHALISGEVPEEFIRMKWPYGHAEIRAIWADNMYTDGNHGADLTKLANYLFDHHGELSESKHRYHRTKNIEKPEEEAWTVCKRHYSEEKPPIAPKGYTYLPNETKITPYGYQYYKYIWDPDGDILNRPAKRKRE